ncbi:sigma factor, partial [Bacteroides thetaiotaomicron]|uniref:sigma factor n=1 Tax=Bacteroides thetaiotaomicron TaxID=818 RepID=UPI00293D3A4D
MEKVDFTQGILAMESDLHRFAYKLTSDRDSANDLVQDCVLQALDNHEKFTHAKNLKGWMFTIMRNIFVNNYRRTEGFEKIEKPFLNRFDLAISNIPFG